MKKSIFCLLLLMPSLSLAMSITFQKVVDTQTAIPQGQGQFTFLDAPYIYHGKIVFRGFGINNQAGVYTNLFNILQVIANTDTKVPEGKGTFTGFGIPTPPSPHEYQTYQYLAYDSPALNDQGVVFTATGSNHQAGNYLFQNNKLTLIASTNTAIPEGNGDFSHFDSPYFNGDNISFLAQGPNKQQGIYSFNNGHLQMLYNTTTSIPSGNGTFQSFWNPDFDNGYSAFRGNGSNKQLGVYDDVNGHLTAIADLHTLIPNGQGNFTSLGAPSLQQGTVAFRGSGNNNQGGIYMNFNDKLQPVVTLQSSIPDGVGNFTGVFNPTIDAKNIVFTGTGGNQQQGIYVYYDGRLQKVINTSDTLNQKKIKTLDLGAVALSNNQIAFHVVFSDDTQAIYIATLRP